MIQCITSCWTWQGCTHKAAIPLGWDSPAFRTRLVLASNHPVLGIIRTARAQLGHSVWSLSAEAAEGDQTHMPASHARQRTNWPGKAPVLVEGSLQGEISPVCFV